MLLFVWQEIGLQVLDDMLNQLGCSGVDCRFFLHQGVSSLVVVLPLKIVLHAHVDYRLFHHCFVLHLVGCIDCSTPVLP